MDKERTLDPKLITEMYREAYADDKAKEVFRERMKTSIQPIKKVQIPKPELKPNSDFSITPTARIREQKTKSLKDEFYAQESKNNEVIKDRNRIDETISNHLKDKWQREEKHDYVQQLEKGNVNMGELMDKGVDRYIEDREREDQKPVPQKRMEEYKQNEIDQQVYDPSKEQRTQPEPPQTPSRQNAKGITRDDREQDRERE